MTTSEEGKKLKNVEPHWQPDGLLNIASERYAKRKETLADVLLLAERLSKKHTSFETKYFECGEVYTYTEE